MLWNWRYQHKYPSIHSKAPSYQWMCFRSWKRRPDSTIKGCCGNTPFWAPSKPVQWNCGSPSSWTPCYICVSYIESLYFLENFIPCGFWAIPNCDQNSHKSGKKKKKLVRYFFRSWYRTYSQTNTKIKGEKFPSNASSLLETGILPEISP